MAARADTESALALKARQGAIGSSVVHRAFSWTRDVFVLSIVSALERRSGAADSPVSWSQVRGGHGLVPIGGSEWMPTTFIERCTFINHLLTDGWETETMSNQNPLAQAGLSQRGDLQLPFNANTTWATNRGFIDGAHEGVNWETYTLYTS